eukprot:TRINITY_DN8689_c0_g1_i1.p2 TRINITY_DN8689_c0_g1~~TRINITY_DN8689_c0_g1_i1.p2  ORF type:complete len:231 (-),score=37.77 TRINITY_DN8689_c0_g1_i1:198-818(-)
MASQRRNKSNESSIQLGSDPPSFLSEQHGCFTKQTSDQRISRATRPNTDTAANIGFRPISTPQTTVTRPSRQPLSNTQISHEALRFGSDYLPKEHWASLKSVDYNRKQPEPFLPVIHVNHFGGSGYKFGSDTTPTTTEYKQQISQKDRKPAEPAFTARIVPNTSSYDLITGQDTRYNTSLSRSRRQEARESLRSKTHIITGEALRN